MEGEGWGEGGGDGEGGEGEETGEEGGGGGLVVSGVSSFDNPRLIGFFLYTF